MVAPCDKYQGLVVGPDGQTVSDPFGFVPTLADYEEWRAVTIGIIERAEQELAREVQVRGAVSESEAAAVESLRVRWDAMGNAIVQSFEFNFTWGPSIVEMVGLAQDAACQLGEVEARIVEAGGAESKLPTQPDRPSKKGAKGGGKGAGLGLVLGIGFALYLMGERKRR